MRPAPRNLIAIAIGIFFAGVSMVVLNSWIDGLIARQGSGDFDTIANRSIHLAETRMSRVLSTLDQLDRSKTAGCGHLDALRSANLSVAWLKELSVLGPDGQTLCSDLGATSELRRTVTSLPIGSGRDLIEVITIGQNPERMVRLRRPLADGHSLAAVMSADVLVAKLGIKSDALVPYARLALADGTVIDEIGSKPQDTAADDANMQTRRSEKFGLLITMVSSRLNVASGPARGFREIGTVVTGMLALILLGFAFLLPWRQADNPILELERALKAGEFIPYYQPIVDITNGRLRGAEILMRWRKRDGQIVSPAVFIPLAESSDLILEMTRSMMRQVVDDIGPACASRGHLRLMFNMTARHFADEVIVDDLKSIFHRSPIRLSQVALELTERQPLENLTKTRRVIAALQEMGVKIAIDDVGAGHGGLSYMLKLGVDIIKIDKMFIDALGHDNHSTTIIETLVDLARNMRMDIVAEGVENFEQVVALRERGIRVAQGYVFAPPLPAASFLQLLDAIDPQSAQPSEERSLVAMPFIGRRKAASAA